MDFKTYSTSELRLELEARFGHSARGGLEMFRANSAREPRPDLATVVSPTIFKEITSRQKSIYGEDDRQEVQDVADEVIQKKCSAVAAIFKVNDVIANEGTVSVTTTSLADEYESKGKPLCPNEPFRTQPASAIGTAFLVRPRVVATAAHCLNTMNLHTRRFIFSYEISAEGPVTAFPFDHVYAGVRILGWELDQEGADWALVELDREVADRAVLPIRSDGKIDDNAPVYVIGHPAGLPKKVAGNANVRVNTIDEYFVANLDTFGGNSGSPVFNSETHLVEGILARGDTDFAPVGNCMASLVCPVQGCQGEHCTRISFVLEHLNS